MIIYSFLLSQLVFGDNVWGIRLLAFVFSFITVILIGLVAKRVAGVNAFWATVFLLSVMLILPVNFGYGNLADIYYAANTEIFMLLPLSLILYFFVKYSEKAAYKHWFLTGILTTVAVSYKPICLVVILFIYSFWIYRAWKKDGGLLNTAIKIGFTLVGGLLSALLIYLPFIWQDGGRAIWKQMVGFTSCYKSWGNWDYGIGQFINRLLLMGKYYWLIYLLVVFYILNRSKDRLFYTGLLLISYLSVYQSIIGHYYILMMPFLALVGGLAIDKLSTLPLFKKTSFWVFTVTTLIILLWPVSSMFGKSPAELGVWVYGNLDPHVEAQIVGGKIKDLTNAHDFVFIEGMDPEILYFTQRRSSVRMEWTNFLSSDCPVLSSYKEDYVRDLEKNTPKVISVCVSGSCRGVWEDEKAKPYLDNLRQMISKDYVFAGGWIPKDGSGYWVDKIIDDNLDGFRTIVYIRK